MDLDADGNDEIISGSYWPGHIFVFKGLGEGRFGAGEKLADESGRPVLGSKPWADENDPEMDSLAAAPWMVDFDGDGDLDLLIGNIAGRIILVRNVGTTREAKFTTERVPLKAGTDPIAVPGGDAGPHTVDWDGDGKWDLLSGAGDGSVWLFRNVGEQGRPVFAAGRTLIAAGKRGHEPLKPREEPREQGSRTKVCAVDYDGDGHLDLLVGDFASRSRPAPELTEAQRKRRDELRAQRDTVAKEYSELWAKLKDRSEKERAEALQPTQVRMQRIYSELQPLEPASEPCGWVWFFRSRPPAPIRSAR